MTTMAYADYRLCDLCGDKAFYDARLNYDFDGSGSVPTVLYAGERGAHKHTLDYLGDWAVLCTDCAKTHRTRVEPINPEPHQMATPPLTFAYDPDADVLTINGVRYAGCIFRGLGIAPPGSMFSIESRQDGLLTLRHHGHHGHQNPETEPTNAEPNK